MPLFLRLRTAMIYLDTAKIKINFESAKFYHTILLFHLFIGFQNIFHCHLFFICYNSGMFIFTT